MCHQDFCPHLSGEEATTADEKLLIYCKPVELYNILRSRALQNPSFLQRCLQYKVQSKLQRRLKLKISYAGTIKEGVQMQSLQPLYILLAKPQTDTTVGAHCTVYGLCRVSQLIPCIDPEGRSRAEATFILPEINKFSRHVKNGALALFLVSCGECRSSLSEGVISGDNLWGKVPLESLYLKLDRCVSLTLGHRVEMLSNVDMWSSFVQPFCLEEGSYITLQNSLNSGIVGSKEQVQVKIVVEEVGARERSPYDSYACNYNLTPSFFNIIRLRAGNVIFNYRDLDNMLQKTEVTEDFSCPFCLMQCSSFKGLRHHLCSSHDLFNFEFWVTEEYQAVNVSVKIDVLRSEPVADGVNPRLQTFFLCSKPRKRRRVQSSSQNAKYVYPHLLEPVSPNITREGRCNGSLDNDDVPNMSPEVKAIQSRWAKAENEFHDNPGGAHCIEHVASSCNIAGLSGAMAHSMESAYVNSVSGSVPTVSIHCAKTKKLTCERQDPKSHLLLRRRQFYHSHRAQPMAVEQVFSDLDSEDDIDDDIADFEDLRMLDDFVDVTKDEKQLMHRWNSFVRKQRVLADGHVPWACEAFSKLHGQELVRTPSLFWCWRLFMIKLWNHGLLDARTMDNCSTILQVYQNESGVDANKG